MKKLITYLTVAIACVCQSFAAVVPSCYKLTYGSLNPELSHVSYTNATSTDGSARIAITANLYLPPGDTGYYDVMITEWRSDDGINEYQYGAWTWANQSNALNVAGFSVWAPRCETAGPKTIRLHIWVWPAGVDHNQVSPSINYIQLKRP